jgi:predicted DNA-binding transcriptional regulator YafY
MSKKQFIKRYSLIINKLRRRPCSYEEITNFLQRESELDADSYEISKRTFQRDLKEIASIYNIEISYNRTLNVYEIISDGTDDRNERLMESFELFHALNFSDALSHHLILEKRKPLGTHLMYGLLHAIKAQVEISFVHEKFWDNDNPVTHRKVQPMALKEARHRWYLIARDERDQILKAFGLDRMSQLEISKRRFTPVSTAEIDKKFKNCFGIISEKNTAPVFIKLLFSTKAAKYVKTLPLHESQRVVEQSDAGVFIEVFLAPTFDFYMELLSFGKDVVVLEPNSVKAEITRRLKEAIANY